MSAKEPASADSDHEPQVAKNAVLILLGDIADTTWRMFVPTIGLGATGYFVDKELHSQPIFTISGIVLGAIAAGLFIRQQLRKVK